MKYLIEKEIYKDGSKIFYDIYESSSIKKPRSISKPHIHTYYEMVYCTGGTMQFHFAGDMVVTLQENDIMVVFPNEIHGTAVVDIPVENGGLRQHVVKFSPQFLYPMNPVPSDIKYLMLPMDYRMPYTIIQSGTPIHGRLHQLLEDCHREMRHKEAGYELAIRSSIYWIYTFLIRHFANLEELHEIPSEAGKANTELISYALAYIEEHYTEKLNMEQVARECNINYYHFSRLFQQYTHQSFRDYLLHFRINKARKMLLQTNDSVTSIAIECGFETISYFIKKFQQITGFTPKRFRKEYYSIPSNEPFKGNNPGYTEAEDEITNTEDK